MNDDRPEVLFVCVHNAGRSQMAAGLLAKYVAGLVIVRSGGTNPAESMNPVIVAAMAEVGVDLTTVRLGKHRAPLEGFDK